MLIISKRSLDFQYFKKTKTIEKMKSITFQETKAALHCSSKMLFRANQENEASKETFAYDDRIWENVCIKNCTCTVCQIFEVILFPF